MAASVVDMSTSTAATFSHKFCVMHVVSSSKSNFVTFHNENWKRFVDFATMWLKFDCRESEIVTETAMKLGLDFRDHASCIAAQPTSANVGYHYNCYQRFCDISKIRRKEAKTSVPAADDRTNMNPGDDGQASVEQEVGEPPRKRMLRSDDKAEKREWRKRHMFPEECIFCHSHKYKRSRITGTRAMTALVICELVTGGQLLEAARRKGHTEMLELIEGEDLVARELQYHRDCYKSYTRFLSKEIKPLSAIQTGYMNAFAQFSEETIKTRLLQGKEILTLARLNRIFIRTIKQVEGIHAPYRTWNLKKRLQKTFPQLVFVPASKRNMSDIVFSEQVCTEDLAPGLADEGSTSSESSTDDEDDNDAGGGNVEELSAKQGTDNSDCLRVMYNAALMLKSDLDKQSSSVPWPPTAEDLTLEKTKAQVPHRLFNFLAWITGASDDAEGSTFVSTTVPQEHRLISISQDIMFAKNSKKPMAKHYALATAVRHLTGSAQIVGILNGLGHSIAHTTLLEYGTALATQQVNVGDNALPAQVQQRCFTTIVWDNIDFGEDTLSGKGTTHGTNGIMIQRPTQAPSVVPTCTPTIKRTRTRTLHPPPTEITTFLGLGQKKGPPCIGMAEDVSKNARDVAEVDGRNLDSAYHLLKTSANGIPGWTGFNTHLTSKYPQKSVIAYLPVLNASPTEMDTVQTILTQSMRYSEALELPMLVLVFDQAIYAKAQQIRWRDETLQQRLVIRLGMFHTKMSYLACIGRRYKDAGLADILIESGVVAEGSINGVMNGHHYNRSMRANKLMYDALRKLQWEAYVESSDEHQKVMIKSTVEKLESGFQRQEIGDVISSQEFNDVVSAFTNFMHKMCKESSTFAFWATYVDMVENVLLLTRATRTGNWEMHLSSVRRILPWLFAYDRPNYARYLSAYYLEMCDLPTTHPTAYEALSNGEFAVQRQEGHGFAQVECDMCIEQTCNRDAKTKGGLIGFTTNHGAVLRWLLTQHKCSAITNACKAMAGKEADKTRLRKDLDKSRIERDQKDVAAIISTVRSMSNPFDVEGPDLFHLSSGVIANDKVKQDLLHAEKVGETCFTSFCRDRLQKENDTFFDPIKRQQLATFEAMKQKSVSKVKGKTVTLKADRQLLARLVFIAKVRNINIQHLMTYCLGPLPLPFATEQGTLVKTNKASLMHLMESAVKNKVVVDSIPARSVWIIDGMAMMQQLHSLSAPTTFFLLAEFLLKKIVKMADRQGGREIHFVADTYPEISIKNAERGRRAATGIQIIKIQPDNTNQKRPTQWKKFLSAGRNKESFVEYLLHTWKKCPADIYKNVTVYLAHGKMCHALSAHCGEVEAVLVPELCCHQEEADTRLLLHARYAQKSLHQSTTSPPDSPAVIIKSMDTDVLIISMGCAEKFTAPLLFHTGRGDKVRTLDIKSLCSQHGFDVASALVGFHPFTGCDSVSGFFGKGKIKPFKLMIKHESYIHAFQELGASFVLSDNLVSCLEQFVCHMYGQEKTSDVNVARYDMFRLGTYAEESLPPNKDSLLKHILRANYQAGVFRRCLEQEPTIPSPHDMGWKIKEVDGTRELGIDWCSLPPAPDDILELTNCRCKKGRCKHEANLEVQTPSQASCCSEIGMLCTELCQCIGCQNVQIETAISDDGESDSDDEG